MPSGQLWEAYKSILLVNGTMYRLIAMPPSAPQEAVEALRAGGRAARRTIGPISTRRTR